MGSHTTSSNQEQEWSQKRSRSLPVRDESQVREGLLRRADLALRPGEEVGEVDEEAAVALTLVRRKSQDAGYVEVL